MADISDELLDQYSAAVGAVAKATAHYRDIRQTEPTAATAAWLDVLAARIRYEEINAEIDRAVDQP